MLPEYDLGMKNMGRHVSIWALVEKKQKTQEFEPHPGNKGNTVLT